MNEGTYFPADPENLQRLKDAGFRVVTLTNPGDQERLLSVLRADGSEIPSEELFAVLSKASVRD